MLLSTVIYYIHPANYTIETASFFQLEVFCKAGLLQFRVAFKSSAFTQQKWIFISVKLTEMNIARNSISLRCAHVNTSIVCRLNRYEFFACGRNEVLCKRGLCAESGSKWYLPYFVTSQVKKRIVYDGKSE